MQRLIGNDKVAPEARTFLRRLKALKQGIELRGRAGWWPALEGLSDEDQRRVRDDVRDHFVWAATAPRFTADGRRLA